MSCFFYNEAITKLFLLQRLRNISVVSYLKESKVNMDVENEQIQKLIKILQKVKIKCLDTTKRNSMTCTEYIKFERRHSCFPRKKNNLVNFLIENDGNFKGNNFLFSQATVNIMKNEMNLKFKENKQKLFLEIKMSKINWPTCTSGKQ